MAPGIGRDIPESSSLEYTNIALLVDAVKGPFVLEFTTGAENPNPLYLFLIVIIRDADTKKIIAEDGYGRQYSTERDKRIVIYRKARFHVSIYGNRVRADIRVKTLDTSPPSMPAPPAIGRGEPEY